MSTTLSNSFYSSHNLVNELELFSINNRRYMGSKYKLLTHINSFILKYCEDINSVADVFGGTGVITDMFASQGKKTIVNDFLLSNYHSYNTFFSSDEYDDSLIKNLLADFNNLIVKDKNYVSDNFGGKFFSFDNASKIGYIRQEIETLNLSLTSREYSILITSLIYAMDKVANTCGHYDAYRQSLTENQPLLLRYPDIKKLKYPTKIYKTDANLLVKNISADLIYIDPPYNSRQYGDAYHLLENIVEWKQKPVEGVAKKYANRTKSDYCTTKAHQALSDLVSNIKAKYIIISYNNMEQKGAGRSNARVSHEEIIGILEQKGEVIFEEINFKPFTTGKSNHSDHKELLYLCKVK